MCVFEMCVRAVSDQLSAVDSLSDSCICVSDSVVCQACATVHLYVCVCLNMFCLWCVGVCVYVLMGRWRHF